MRERVCAVCGVAGFFAPKGFRVDAAREVLLQMGDSLRHRGPDDAGQWLDAEAGVGFAHRRLSIIDLSTAGHQPMISACGRYVAAYNGEIYNAGELRAELEEQGVAPSWRGHSDTEVMLAAISAWGFRQALCRFNGMFAIAIWDKKECMLTLVRDRLGEKPIYYGWIRNSFVFGSELKALKCFPGWNAGIDRDALTLHLRYGYIPAPRTIFSGIRKLQAGTLIEVKCRGGEASGKLDVFWSPLQAALSGLADPLVATEHEVLEQVEAALVDAVALRSVADVPVGVFLSGGIDSSLVAALMRQHSGKCVRTFSIGFDERAFDEAPYARAIARHLGTEHTEFYVSPADALAVVPLLPIVYDEPFGDASQIPTYLVSKLTRRHVTVTLTGDGGDETFCGYTRYRLGALRWKVLSRVPLPARRLAAALLRSAPDPCLRLLAQLTPHQRTAGGASSPLATRVIGLAELLSSASASDINAFMMSAWRRPDEVVLGAKEPHSVYTADDLDVPAVQELMMVSDFMQYLPDDILVKTDRASMAVSLEARAPLLDHRLTELAWRLPLSLKIRDGVGKWPLRQLLARHVPPALFERPKMGFGVPLAGWLRGPLREWAEDLLTVARLRRDNLFDVDKVRERWIMHRDGVHNWAPHLWYVLSVQSWLDAQVAA